MNFEHTFKVKWRLLCLLSFKFFRKTGAYKLDETFTNSLPSITAFTAYEVDFVFWNHFFDL